MIIDHYAGSETMGMEYRPYYLGKNWVEMGHSVTIVCGSFSHMRRKNPMIGEDLKEETENGVQFVYLNTPTYTQTGTSQTGKLRNIYSFIRKLKRYSQQLTEKYTPDIVIASSTYPFDWKSARRIARMSGGQFVYEIRDLLPLSLCELYHFRPNSYFVALTKYVQKKAVQKADLVTSVISHADRYLNEIGVTAKEYYYIPNGTNTTQVKTTHYPTMHIETIEKYRAKGKFVVVYLGEFSETNRLDLLIDVAKKLNGNYQFVLIGNGSERKNLKKMAAQAHINTVHFLDSVPKVCQQEVMRHADCLYLGTKNSILYDYGLGMNKIYDYLLAGRPIIFATENEENPVSKANCGVIVKPDDPLEIIRGIGAIQSLSQEERAEMGQRGKDYCIEHHDYKKIAQQFLNVLEDSIEKTHFSTTSNPQKEVEA